MINYHHNIINIYILLIVKTITMKYIRLGFTESTLLFIYYLEYILNVVLKQSSIELKKNMINWLYTTSGFYDKLVTGTYFNFDYKNIENSFVYISYMKKLMRYIQQSDRLELCFHKMDEDDEYKKNFITYLNPKENAINFDQQLIYNITQNKRVLLISSFAELMKEQYESNNCKKIFNNFPDFINILTYTTPYTFFNNGPDNNCLETCLKIQNDIKKIIEDFDIALIAFGSYSALIAGYINELNKDACIMGGEMQQFFGIASKRHTPIDTKYWITEIPEKYKPIDYLKIENGCYW